MSFAMSDYQRRALAEAQLCKEQQKNGMAKWEIVFHDGNRFPYLTNDCRDRASALLAAVERFGSRVMDVR